ncbi:MAG: CBS domain-containing protein [Planctomyces sp.]|nr:CBS domain-containing protein [Planctomyces sp.]
MDMIDSSATVEEAARQMAASDIGFLPVVHESVCAGAVTDRDLVTRVLAAGLDPKTTLVREVMSHPVRKADAAREGGVAGLISISADAPLDEALARMNERNVTRLAVHDENQRLIGIISRSDAPAFRPEDAAAPPVTR